LIGDIDGSVANEHFGQSVSISPDGTRIAVGGPFLQTGSFPGTASPTSDASTYAFWMGTFYPYWRSGNGVVRIYEYVSPNNWTQVGSDITHTAPGYAFGWSVDLSENGTRVVVGCPGNTSFGGTGIGARVFEESGGSWSAVGGGMPIWPTGQTYPTAQDASHVLISYDGTRIVVGSPRSGVGNDGISVFEESGGTWSRIFLLQDTNGKRLGEHIGFSKKDGKSIIGGNYASTYDVAYMEQYVVYKEIGGVWSQYGARPLGFNDGSVTLSHDGSRLFLGQAGNHLAGGVYASYSGGLAALSNPSNSSGGGVVNMNFVPVSSAAFHVGVGTLTPSATLHVVGNVYSSGNVEASKFVGDGSLLTGLASNLHQVAENGNVTSTTIEFTNATTGFIVNSNSIVTGNVTAGTFLGDGSGLTALNATNIASGTLDVARIPNLNTSKLTAGTLSTSRGGTGTTSVTGSGSLVKSSSPTFSSIYNTDYMYHSGDTNTYIGFSAADTIVMRTAGVDRLKVNSDGNVGIGTASPHAPLSVFGTRGSIVGGSYRTYFSSGDLPVNTGSGWSSPGGNDLGIFSQSTISTNGSFITMNGTFGASDERIKKDIVDIDDGSALETLRLLKPKQYKYKDDINRGSEPVWGFIAQEVRETLPYATQLRKECLPNIYELANVSDSNVITLTNFDTSNLESNAMVLKMYDIDDKEHLVNIVEVVDGHSVRVDEDLSEWMGSVNETGNVVAGNQIFMYGQEVDDFIYLKKDAIWTVATAALQEVDRQQQADKLRITELETQLTSVLTRLDALENA